jgi:DNA mismatch repair protein MutH
VIEAPRDEHELRVRAFALAGRRLDDLAKRHGAREPAGGATTKGKVGALIESVLGARGGSAAVHDFPELEIELKTIPIDARGAPRESTYVCTIDLQAAERAEWRTSWARRKLAHVLFVPIVDGEDGRRVGTPVFWQPTREQDAILGHDFDEAMGKIATGGVEALDARAGRWMQVRPKAADGRPRAVTYGRDGERIATVPRGFYLRARFTAALLRDPAATPP